MSIDAPAAVNPSIELRDVRKRFGDVVAVAGVSLEVAQGEFLTLLGPSGCGKTTTLRMIGGFELPTSGSLRINGEEMGDLPPHKRPVNTVFQNYALFPHLTLGRNIEYGLRMANVGKAERVRRVAEALEMVHLPGVDGRKPSELSGGQQQRVALARALVNRPQVLLLDEPLGALDLKLRKAMQLELKRLNREVGATFIYVTHDQEEALSMSDRIAVMNAGRILQVGLPGEIYESPRSRFVADFIGQTNFLEGRLAGSRDGLAEVILPSGATVRGRMAPGVSPAGVVTIAVRPERLVLFGDGDDGAPPGWSRLDGVVTDVIYLGTHSQHVVDVGGGATVVVHRQNRRPADVEHGGADRVTVAFDPSAASILLD
ncbi:MAG: ABC transporter ATP-binding protein [Thermomicrobiales bacterium]